MKKKKLNEILKLSSEEGVKYEELVSIHKKMEREILQGTKTLSRVPFNAHGGAKVWREVLKPALEAYDYVFAAMESQAQAVKGKMLRKTREENQEKAVEEKELRSEDNKA